MISFIITSILCFIIYLLLTTGSGTFGLWSLEEILIGIILSLITGFITRKIFIKKDFRMLNPVRWITFIAYIIGPFFIGIRARPPGRASTASPPAAAAQPGQPPGGSIRCLRGCGTSVSPQTPETPR